MKQKKSTDSGIEAVALEILQSSSPFGRAASPYDQDDPNEPIQNPELEEEDLESEEQRDAEGEQVLQEEVPPYQENITSKYLRDLEKIPLLNSTQEVDLAKRIKEGERLTRLFKTKTPRLKAQQKKRLRKSNSSPPDVREGEFIDKKTLTQFEQAAKDTRKAKDELIQANLRLVVSIAKRYANRGLPFLDLIQEGNIGLLQAAAKFDYTRGCKFSTYATWWIRAAILRGFAEKAKTIRVPNYIFEIKGKLLKSFQSLTRRLERDPTPEELSEDLRIPLTDVEKVLNVIEEPISLHMPIGEGDSTLEDLIADQESVSPSDSLVQKNLTYQTHQLLNTLSPREEKILRLRFGIGTDGELTLEEIGKQFNLSRERIRQIEAKAMERLRDPKRYKDVRKYLEL